MEKPKPSGGKGTLSRQLGLVGLAATGICSMLGASVYVVPFMIQRNVPGIGPDVLTAFALAAVPALLAAAAYAILASAMPRAGGSYIYASRGLNPYLGFVASFSQWFGLSIAIGVISYITIPFFRDIAEAMEWNNLATWLNMGRVRLGLSLGLLWIFVGINIMGLRFYERTLIPLMIVMFCLGVIVIIAGFYFTPEAFAQSLLEREGRQIPDNQPSFRFSTLLTAAALLFSSFIGFDSIAQAGGEAKRPRRNLPIAIAIAVLGVGTYYFLFTAAVYHVVPWSFVAEEAIQKDISAPGLLSYVLSPGWSVIIILGAAIALINDLPAMLLSVSRLMFAWAEDGIFPRGVANIYKKYQTPYIAILVSGGMASIGILGSHLAGDFFLGIDIMVTAMLVNFLLMCITVISLPSYNPALAKNISVFTKRSTQLLLAIMGIVSLMVFLVVHTAKDLNTQVDAWYFHSTWVWLLVLGLASLIFLWKIRQLKRTGVSVQEAFKSLPPEHSKIDVQ
ncbi:MAG: APC family permease [Saprospiraceae bacterium]|nr:APC family permease [Saprospiraceae bacterium]